MAVYCGIDWAEGHHDIALVDSDGTLVAKRRIKESPEGIAELTAMLAAAGDSAENPVPVAIETPRGLLVAVLRATGRPVYPVNPLAVARYRERASVSGKKSDHADAMTLANILRIDAHLHRKLPDDTGLARSITVLARAYQDAVWRRTKLVQDLRARLQEYYPAFLAAFASRRRLSATQLASSDARAVLAIAPSPAEACGYPRRGSRQRSAAPAASAGSPPGQRASSPRCGPRSCARSRSSSRRCGPRSSPCSACWMRSATRPSSSRPRWQRRFASTRTTRSSPASRAWPTSAAPSCSPRQAMTAAGSATTGRCRPSPAPRRSPAPPAKSRTVTRRRTKNNRLAAVGYSWAFTAASRPSPAREHYLRRRDRGDGHPAALRHLFNRMLGQLHHCLRTGQLYDPASAFPHATPAHAEPAAA